MYLKSKKRLLIPGEMGKFEILTRLQLYTLLFLRKDPEMGKQALTS
jgi:hypothetical protein